MSRSTNENDNSSTDTTAKITPYDLGTVQIGNPPPVQACNSCEYHHNGSCQFSNNTTIKENLDSTCCGFRLRHDLLANKMVRASNKSSEKK